MEENRTGLEVAVIGAAGRFPGARNLDQFWHNLKHGIESITFFTDQELQEMGTASELLNDPHYVKARGVLTDLEYFDAAFFGYLPREAEIMDPQLRFLHETAWEALENAGYNADAYSGLIGTYIGGGNNLFWMSQMMNRVNQVSAYELMTLNKSDFFSTRLAYKLNLRGPAYTVQTACSSSLVSIHLACQSLLNGECDMALAGGVGIGMPQKTGYFFKEGMISSPDGHCRAFDAQSEGTVSGNGVGIVVLKRLEDALRDGDHIYAIVRGSAMNNDGLRKVGFTAPSVEGQSQVIQAAHYMAEVEPDSISYVETHGTGTILGDPIEIEALKLAFDTPRKGFCGIASVKTNIGHLDYAAGVAGFLKTVLVLKNRMLPPSLHFSSPNPKIHFEDTPFYVNTRLVPWENSDYPLRAGVSSFGIGGTNAHIVLEEAPAGVESSEGRTWKLLPLSARSASALQRMSDNLARHLKEHDEMNFADMAYTLQVGRKEFHHRRMIVASTKEEAIQKLRTHATLNDGISVLQSENIQLVFYFQGNHPVGVNLGKELYQKEKRFREEMDSCFEVLKNLGLDLKPELYPTGEGADRANLPIQLAIPARVAYEVAMARSLNRWGVTPSLLSGDGIGEYPAACLAGVLSLEDALKLAVWQGQLAKGDGHLLPAPVIRVQIPQIPLISSVTGAPLTEVGEIPYWTRLRVESSNEWSLEMDGTVSLSIGDLQCRDREGSEHHQLLWQVGQLWLTGVSIDWKRFAEEEMHRRVPLPTYPFEGQFFPFPTLPTPQTTSVGRTTDQGREASILYRRTDLPEDYLAPRNEVEETIASIYQESLGLDRIGMDEDCFNLGLDSLKVIDLAARLRKRFQMKIPLPEIFRRRTIGEIAEWIGKATEHTVQQILPAPRRDHYPLSFAQKRLFTIHRMATESISYNLPIVLQVEGQLDRNRLEWALGQLIQRHEALRTSIVPVNGEPVQRIEASVEFSLSEIDDRLPVEERVQRFIRPFDLAKGPLLRVALTPLADGSRLLLVDMHHIIADGVSRAIFTRELVGLYQGKTLPPIHLHYKDFAEWQQSKEFTETLNRQREYWKNVLSGELSEFEMSTDYTRPAFQSFTGAIIVRELDTELQANLFQLVEKTGATLYMILLAAYNVLLSRYSGQEDIIVGSPIAGRSRSELTQILGMFVNTLVMRNYPESRKSFLSFLAEVKENAIQAFENQDYPFEELLDELNIRKDFSRNPLFDTVFALQNIRQEIVQMEDIQIQPYPVDVNASQFDIEMSIFENANALTLTIRYCTALFKEATMRRFADHFTNILLAIVRDPDIRLGEIEVISSEEKDLLLYGFNQKKLEFNPQQSIYHFIEEIADRYPTRIALSCNGTEMTYRELNRKANQLARMLQESGIQTEETVGVLLERSPWMVISILAIWKTGGAYIPLDVKYPVQRVIGILNDSRSRLLISESPWWRKDESTSEYTGKIIYLDEERDSIVTKDTDNLNLSFHPGQLAYVIYTSGSTGKPKGAMVEHVGMMNHIHAKIADLHLDSHTVVAQNASHCFDISVWQFFVALTLGGKTIIYSNDTVLNPEQFLRQVQDDGISILEVVPSYLSVILDTLSNTELELMNVKYLIVTGETLNFNLVKRWFATYPTIPMVNAYGPTEASDDITHFIMTDLPPCEQVLIGSPLHNLRIYIVDQEMRLCPIGVKGEICVVGIGVGRGYLHDPDRTALAFTDDPFAQEKGVRLYKTGDLGRWLPDGTIDFYGRKDYQVKVRGFRIELGEIEAKLLTYPGVKEAAVIVRGEEQENSYLCAYLVAQEGIDLRHLGEYLARQLPDYMIPTQFVELQEMPLTANGKLARKALPQPEREMEKPEQASGEVEEILHAIWYEVLLNRETIGVHENFFEVGGNSLKATSLLAKVHKELNVEVSVVDFFTHATIKGLARIIQNAKRSLYTSIQPAEKWEFYPLSSAQKRIYTLQQMDEESTAYNIPFIFTIEGDLEVAAFQRALQELVQRHEALRTSLVVVDGVAMQKVHEHVEFPMEYLEITDGTELPSQVQKLIRPFNLEEAPLCRITLLKVSPDRHIFVGDIHHIISDGISTGVIVSDFSRLFRGKSLAPMRIQYVDYAVWQQEMLNSHALEEQERFWLDQFAGEVPILQLPYDYPRPPVQSFTGGRLKILIEEGLARRVKDFARERKVTLYMVLLAALNTLLYRYSGQEDIVVGSPTAGRPHVDLEGIVGVFVNTVAIRSYPKGHLSFDDMLKQIKKTALQVYEHQDFQFEELVERLGVPRGPGRNPLFDIMLVLQNMNETVAEVSQLKFTPYEYEILTAKFDLTITAIEKHDTIQFTFDYATALFSQGTVEKMMNDYIEILNQVTANSQLALKDIRLENRIISAEAWIEETDFVF